LFISESREINKYLPMLIWDRVYAESIGPLPPRIHFQSEKNKILGGFTVARCGDRASLQEEIACAQEQLRTWTKMKTSLTVLISSSVVTVCSRCLIAEYNDKVFTLVGEQTKQVYMIDLSRCAAVSTERARENATIILNGSWGDACITISDVNTTPEEAFGKFRFATRLIH
jgi:hypothetical protein